MMRGLPLLMAAVVGVAAIKSFNPKETIKHKSSFRRSSSHSSFPSSSSFVDEDGSILHYNFPSEADTLAYVDALKHSDLSDWRSLEEVAARAGGGSCSGAVTTSVLTALYLLGLFNLCVVSPVSCCMPPITTRKRRSATNSTGGKSKDEFASELNSIKDNLSSISLDQFKDLPHVSTSDGGTVPVHVSVVEQVRKLWDSNPRLLSSVTCQSATESVRSSFISLSGVASGIILAYSVAQLSQCYPDVSNPKEKPPKLWFFDIPKPPPDYSPPQKQYPIPSLPGVIPVPGESEEADGCDRNEVSLEGGKCAPLLSPNHCPYDQWILLNRNTKKGECVPRVCGEGRVFVEKDEMCHHIDEPGLCPRNQRLYLTATGHAVCDCPDGMFQGPYGNCYSLYETAYCSKGLVLQFDKSSQGLACKPDPCGHVNENLWQDDLPYAPGADGFCYQFNADKPCGKGKRFGFDTEDLSAECVSLMDAGLLRARRSYMYHHMSFPSPNDKESPHYQVSYVILNGTTWGLEVKGIGNDKPKRKPRSTEKRIDLIDTRDIPKRLIDEFMPNNTIINKLRQRRRKKHSSNQNIKNGKRKRLKLKRRTKLKQGYLHSKPSGFLNEDRFQFEFNKNNTSNKNFESLKSKEKSILQDSAKSSALNASKNDKEDKINTDNQSKTKFKDDSGDLPKEKNVKTQAGVPNKDEHKNKNNPAKQLDLSNKSLNNTKNNVSSKEETKQNLNKKEHQKILRDAIQEEMKRIIEKKILREKVRKSVESQINTNNLDNRQQVTNSSDTSNIVKKQPKGNKGKHEGDLKSKRGSKSVISKSTNANNAPIKKSKSTRRTKGKTGKQVRRGKRRKYHRKRGRRKHKKGHGIGRYNSRQVRKKRKKKKNPNLPIKVATTTPRLNSSNEDVTKSNEQMVSPDLDSSASENNVVVNEIFENITSTTIEPNTNSTDDLSLSDYLRHRGRRQLGGGGGIIQAPLLSACKPGAKRDYNYKCRPKFIPQERNRRDSDDPSYVKETTPNAPRIKCPKGTRLDPRGQCQASSSILG